MFPRGESFITWSAGAMGLSAVVCMWRTGPSLAHKHHGPDGPCTFRPPARMLVGGGRISQLTAFSPTSVLAAGDTMLISTLISDNSSSFLNFTQILAFWVGSVLLRSPSYCHWCQHRVLSGEEQFSDFCSCRTARSKEQLSKWYARGGGF